MLQVKQLNSESVEVTDKKRVVTLSDASVKIDNQVISSPGEYETGGVEIVFGETGALIIWERIQMAYQFSSEGSSDYDKNQFASADVLILGPALKELSKDQVNNWAESYDPTVIIAPSSINLAEIVPSAAKVQDLSPVKLSEQTLPTEGREYYQLG